MKDQGSAIDLDFCLDCEVRYIFFRSNRLILEICVVHHK